MRQQLLSIIAELKKDLTLTCRGTFCPDDPCLSVISCGDLFSYIYCLSVFSVSVAPSYLFKNLIITCDETPCYH